MNAWKAANYTIDQLAKDLGITPTRLAALAGRIERRGYHPFPDKKNGKTRIFCAPACWLKQVQRRLADRVFPRLPISDHVYSRPGRDVVRHARQHAGRAYKLSMDIRDCFPSTRLSMVRTTLLAAELPQDVAMLVARLVTYKGRLPQGSCCSNAVLDAVLYPLDEALGALATEYGGRYTRFADDLSFSADVPLESLRRRAKKLVRKHGYDLRHEKTRSSGVGEIHTMTGIVVDETLHAPEVYLREVERRISAFRRGRSQKEQSIAGQIQWVGRLNELEASALAKKMAAASAKRRRRRSAPALT